MLSLCFSFKAEGLYPSLLQYSPSNWNNSSFELLVVGIEVFLCSFQDFEVCQELTSGFGIKELCWVEGKGSVPPKSGKVCMSVRCSSAWTSALPPCSRRKWLVQIWWEKRLSQKCPKETCTFLLAALEHTEGRKGFPLGPGLLLEGRLGTQTGESRSWWGL